MPKDEHHRCLKIMVVDDDPIMLEVLRERLAGAGHDVRLRTSPVGTAADILHLGIELVILDVLMPGLRGDDLARMLKRHPATTNVGIVLHSSLPASQLRSLLESTGALGVIEKTANARIFQFALNCLIARLPTRHLREESPPSSRKLDGPASSTRGVQSAPSGTFRLRADGRPQMPESERMRDAPPAVGPRRRR